MIYNAISLWQPWASLIALGAKRYETRSWPTNYRGPLLICAGKHFDAQCRQLCDTEPFRLALSPLRIGKNTDLPCGQALCLVDLKHCWEIDELNLSRLHRGYVHREPLPSEREQAFGDFGVGRFAWELENVRPIKPFAVSGMQRIFKVDIDAKLLESK